MNWKAVLAILTCNVVLMSASYTMLIPFLPMYLINELGVTSDNVNMWSGIIFSVTSGANYLTKKGENQWQYVLE